MSHINLASGLRAAAAAALLGLVGCQGLPTLESIKYGYDPDRVEIQQELPRMDDYNNVGAGWASPHSTAGAQATTAVQYGRDGRPIGASSPDGSPVGSSTAGAVTQTTRPMNDGLAETGSTGSRGTILEKYLAVVEELEILRPQNEDLDLALEMSEMRANDLTEQLKSLQMDFQNLSADKQVADSDNYELAARLATAQIARLEAERALLEATLEWRKMSAANNGEAGLGSGAMHPTNPGAHR